MAHVTSDDKAVTTGKQDDDFCDGNARAESGEYRHQYPGWMQPSRLLAVIHCSLRETCICATSTCWPWQVKCAGMNKCLMCTYTCQVTYAADFCRSPVWLTLYEEQYTFSKGYSQMIIWQPAVLLVASTQNCRWTWLFVLFIIEWWNNIFKGWSKQSPQLVWMSTGGFSCYLILFISSKIWNQLFGCNHGWWTICDNELCHYNPLCWFPWRNAFPFIERWDSVVCIATGYRLDDWGVGVQVPVRSRIFSSPSSSRLALASTQPPIQWVPGALSLGVKRPGREADH
jgi:hypothetical protein